MLIAGAQDFELMQELGVKMNSLNASFLGSVNMDQKALIAMANFFRRFVLKCLGDPKVRAGKKMYLYKIPVL